ncbi:MAG: cation:proton antiporter [Chloroflexi bacterium]|nr:cation:proton antiporter [Chloroflexota bacterium]
MAVAGTALVLFRAINMPPVLGYLLAGVIIGPFTLAAINFGPLANIQGPVQNLQTIRVLAELGLVLLLFGIGLEIGWQRIRQVGIKVVIIGVVEMATMFAVGYELAHWLGWTQTERIFLGAALSISSSAILIKMLRDTGTLFHLRGQLIVGILLVEDFVAVILLTILAGVATTGGASLGDIGILASRLAIFGVAVLTIGALLAPRLMNYIARFESEEMVLIASLTLCFGLALAAHQLGLSAAAGAFLIGMILGDTEHHEQISRLMNPLRDMFAALFFVSLGMLLDVVRIGDYLVPALVISAVFVVGKVLADTLGTLLAGQDGRTALQVGTGMPQLGEFSLAMAKTGVDHGSVSAYFSPALTVATAITALVYPFIFRSPVALANFISRVSPNWLHQFTDVLFVWLTSTRRSHILGARLADDVMHAVQRIMLNVGIIVVLIAAGTIGHDFAQQVSQLVGVSPWLVDLMLGGAVVALCIPSVLAIWHNLGNLTEEVMGFILPPWRNAPANVSGKNLRRVIRNSLLIVILVLPAIWSLPFTIHLFLEGGAFAPLVAIVLLVIVAGVAFAAFQIHSTLEDVFRRTFLGASEHYRYDEHQWDYFPDDSHLYSHDGNLHEQFEPSDD